MYNITRSDLKIEENSAILLKYDVIHGLFWIINIQGIFQDPRSDTFKQGLNMKSFEGKHLHLDFLNKDFVYILNDDDDDDLSVF